MIKNALGLLTKLGGTEKGVLSLISEKTGKISFKRSVPIMIIGYALASGSPANITTNQLILVALGGAVYVGGKFADYLVEKMKNAS